MSHPEGPVYENPSADKFGPPSAPSDGRSDGKLRRRLPRVALGLAVYVLSRWLWTGSRGRSWLPAILLFALTVFDFALSVFDSRMGHHGTDDSPYSPPTHITR